MADIYELPDDVTQLSDEDLDANLSAAVRSFKAVSDTDVVTPQTLPTLRTLKASIQTLKTEQKDRQDAALAAAAEIDQLSADVFGDDATASADGEGDDATAGEGDDDATASADGEGDDTAAVDDAPATTATASAAAPVRRSQISLAAARAKQGAGANGLAKYLPQGDGSGQVTLTAAVDVPGYRPGQQMDSIGDIAEGLMRRAQGLKTAGGGTGMVASYEIPFGERLTINDASSAPEGTTVIARAADQRALPQGDLIASGGWCAPSETLYDIAARDCADMLWDLPEVQINRGGVRYYQTPLLDVAAMTWEWTEAQDIAAATAGGPTKPCFTIQCTNPVDVRAEAVGVCLKYGILQSRYFPELIEANVRNSIAAHEIRVKQVAYNAARNAVPVANRLTIPVSFGAFSAVYGAVALQVADMTERLNLCMNTNLEVVFPLWAKNMFLADIARQQGVRPQDLAANIIQDAFTPLGVRVQWARGLAPDVPTNIGNATPATGWPADLEFLIYEAGAFVLGRGPSIDLGIITDSTLLATNDFQQFSEEGTLLIDRTGTARRVTVTVCANGSVGAVPTAAAACPIA